MVGPHEAGQLERGSALGGPEHHDLGTGAGDADDRVQEGALQLHALPVDLEPEADEEPHRRVEVGDGDAEVVEAPHR